MRVIKFALISVVVLFLLVTGISLFIPSHIRISRAINMKADRDDIMDQINDAANWKNWYVLSGINNKIIIYVRRWYLNDSVGSIEFTYPMDVKAEYEGILTRMTSDLVFSESTPKQVP